MVERRKAGERRSDDGKDFRQPGRMKDDRGIGDGLSHAGGNNRMLHHLSHGEICRMGPQMGPQPWTPNQKSSNYNGLR